MQIGMPYARHIEWSFHSTESQSGPNWKRVQFYTPHSRKRDWRKSTEKHQNSQENRTYQERPWQLSTESNCWWEGNTLFRTLNCMDKKNKKPKMVRKQV